VIEEWKDKNGDTYRFDVKSNRYVLVKPKKKSSRAKKEKKA